MQVSKVLTELRKKRQLVAEAVVSVQRLADGQAPERWVSAPTTKAGPKRADAKITALKKSAAKGGDADSKDGSTQRHKGRK